jgi:hypothetical protein
MFNLALKTTGPAESGYFQGVKMNKYQARLYKGLEGRPLDFKFIRYEYSDEECECACGHKIKNLFHVRDAAGVCKIIGSDCIDVYQDLNPEDAGRIGAFLADAKVKAETEAEKYLSFTCETALQRGLYFTAITERMLCAYFNYMVLAVHPGEYSELKAGLSVELFSIQSGFRKSMTALQKKKYNLKHAKTIEKAIEMHFELEAVMMNKNTLHQKCIEINHKLLDIKTAP